MSLQVTLYTRRRCPLCAKAEEMLRRARRRADFALEILDVDGDKGLRERYSEMVPVIAINGEVVFWGRIEEEALLARLQSGH